MTKPLAIDLFCGLGGWTEGLLAEGYEVIGYDIEEHVYGDMRYPAKLVIQDVLTLHGSQFKDAALIVASPPCQEYSYMAMPWKLAKAKAAAIRADTTGQALADLNRLFHACFRIQAEASLAAGRHIPVVVENVRGAQPWVGRARWNFGSFYLWGDVPAIMPMAVKARKAPGLGHGWKHPSDPRHTPGLDFTGLAGKRSLAESGTKVPSDRGRCADPGKGARFTSRDCGVEAMRPPAKISELPPAEGRKGAGAGAAWFDQNISSLPSSSPRRKAARAMIAKIPLPLCRHIAAVYRPSA